MGDLTDPRWMYLVQDGHIGCGDRFARIAHFTGHKAGDGQSVTATNVAIPDQAILFLGIGLMSVALILIEAPSLRVAVLLALVIWAFCRLYYFAFSVIGRYIDPAFRFAGLGSVIAYLWSRRRGRAGPRSQAGDRS